MISESTVKPPHEYNKIEPLNNAPDKEDGKQAQKKGFQRWLKRIGVFGFLFFLIKGIGWLFVFYFGGDALLDWMGN